MTSKEVTEKQEEIRGIIRELDSHDSESLPINEAFNELGKIQLAYYSRIKELYADLYSDGLIASLLPQPQTLNFKDTFKDRLNSLIKEKPMFSSKYKEYITKCNQHIEAYKKLKASMHIQSNVNYNDLFKALYPTLYDSHTFGERGSSSSSNKQQQCGLPAKRSEVDDDDDDNEKPIDNEKPVDMSGSPGQFASGDAANEVPIGGSADDEIPITQNENDRQQMSRYTDSEVPINSNDDETPMDNTHKEEEERKRKEEEERKRKEEEERKRKEEEERKRKEEEERRKRKEEEERKRKEEEEKKRALFENKFLLLFNIEKGKKFDDPRDIRKVLFANGFLFSRDVFQSVFPCKEEKDIEAMYPNALISNDTKQLRIYEYPAQDQQAYPEGILSINIFNGIETKRDVLCVVDPAHKEVTDWLANHKDHIKPADNVYYHKKNFTKAGAQEELKSLRSSETNFPLWYTFYTKYGSSYLIVATTNSKCNDFQSIQAKDVTDIIKNGCKLEFDLCTGIDKPSCKNGNSCPLFLDKAHMEKYMHPHGENVCPDILTCKGSERNLTHICSKGTKCTRANNKEHCKTNIHLRVCDTYSCKEDSLAHRVGGHPGSVTKQELAKTEKLSLCSCENMHTSTGWTEAIVPNFDLNVAAWIKACKLYVKDDIETSNREFNKIASWFAGLLPVHLCPGSGLVGVTKMGAIISLDTLINVWKTPDENTYNYMLATKEFKAFTDLESFEPTVASYCRLKFTKIREELSKYNEADMKQNITLGVPIDTLKFALEVFSNIPHFGSTEEKELKKYGEELTTKGFTEMIQLDKAIEGYAKLLSEILLKVTPIGFGVDKEIRTNKNVFAIQGFNVGNYGNGEVAIIFKQSIMRHPDFFMTPVAAMGYYQGWYCYNTVLNIDRRQWMGEAQTWNNGARKAYLESMFQLGTRDWHKACAMEWIARVSASSGKAPKDVSLKDIQDMIISSDPHTAIESHLPGFVPLDYVDHVYVKRGVIDSNGIKAIKEANVKYTEVINPKEEVIRIMRTRTLADKDLAGMQGYTFAMPREKEIVLPVNLESIENAGRIRFTAHIKEGDNFVFELKNDKDVLSVVFTKNAVGYAEIDLINTKSAKKADPCKTMCPVPIPGLGIFFSIAIDKAGKKCVVEHTSLSGVDKFEVPLKFKPILFSVYDSDSITDFTYPVTYNKDDLKKAADAAEAAVRKGNAGNATPLHTIKKSQSAAVKVSPSVAAAAGFTSPSPQGVVRTNTAMFQGAGAGLSASMQFSCFEKSQNRPTCGIIERYLSKQLCGNPMYCQTLESVKDPSKVAAHKNKYLHVCKYGQSCRDINIPAHKRDFVHLDKPPCLDNNCKNTDPIHRSDYHHQGCWDYLIPCLHNGCNDTTYQHCCKYQHGATPYYPLLKKY